MSKLLLLAFCICLICSCGRSLVKPSGSGMEFFDFSDFLDSLSMQSSGRDVIKSIHWQGREESRTLENYQWIQDLLKFEDFDLNRPALYDKYEVDSLFAHSGDLRSVAYKAIDLKTEVKYFKVAFSEEKVDSILIEHFRKSFIASSETRLTIIPQKGYDLKLIEDKLFGGTGETEISLRVEVP